MVLIHEKQTRVENPNFRATTDVRIIQQVVERVATEPTVVVGDEQGENRILQKVTQLNSTILIGTMRSRVIANDLISLRVTLPTGQPMIEAELSSPK